MFSKIAENIFSDKNKSLTNYPFNTWLSISCHHINDKAQKSSHTVTSKYFILHLVI